MRTKGKDTVGYTIRIHKETFKTLKAFKAKFRPYMSLNALIVEAIIEQVKRKTPIAEASV